MKRGLFFAAGVGFGFWVGLGLAEVLHKTLWTDQRPTLTVPPGHHWRTGEPL